MRTPVIGLLDVGQIKSSYPGICSMEHRKEISQSTSIRNCVLIHFSLASKTMSRNDMARSLSTLNTDCHSIENPGNNGAADNKNEVTCDNHPDRKAVIRCKNMGYAYCRECRTIVEMRTGGCGYCPNVGHCAIQAYYNKLEEK